MLRVGTGRPIARGKTLVQTYGRQRLLRRRLFKTQQANISRPELYNKDKANVNLFRVTSNDTRVEMNETYTST